MNRRAFFGVAAAAPVAAKQAVSALAFEAQNANTIGLVGGLNYAYPTPEMPTGDWMRDELASLLKRRTRMETEPLPPHVTATAVAMQIDGLRSVSGPVKARMIAEERRRRDMANELSYIDEKIAEYREKLGPLGELFK